MNLDETWHDEPSNDPHDGPNVYIRVHDDGRREKIVKVALAVESNSGRKEVKGG